MARIQAIDDRLQRWALAVTVGDGSGYPVKSVLHPSWQPPAPGTTPTLKTAQGASDVRQTHEAICQLAAQSECLFVAVHVHYILRGTAAQQAEAFAAFGHPCQPETVATRVEAAHRALAALLQARQHPPTEATA